MNIDQNKLLGEAKKHKPPSAGGSERGLKDGDGDSFLDGWESFRLECFDSRR